MGAALAIARAELRARWRPLLALALLIGLGIGGTMSLVAGARRSSTVIDRFREAQSAADLLVQPFEVDPERLAELRAEPSIEAAAPLAVVFAKVQGSDTDIVNESQVRVAVDGRYGVDVDRGRILAGTPLDHDDPHAVEISESVAAEHGLAPAIASCSRPSPWRRSSPASSREHPPGRPRVPCSSWSCNRWCGRPPRPSACPIRAPSCSPVRCGSRRASRSRSMIQRRRPHPPRGLRQRVAGARHRRPHRGSDRGGSSDLGGGRRAVRGGERAGGGRHRRPERRGDQRAAHRRRRGRHRHRGRRRAGDRPPHQRRGRRPGRAQRHRDAPQRPSGGHRAPAGGGPRAERGGGRRRGDRGVAVVPHRRAAPPRARPRGARRPPRARHRRRRVPPSSSPASPS